MNIEIVLVGAGNMGFAMLAGWVKAGQVDPEEIFVVEPNAALRDRAERLGVRVGGQCRCGAGRRDAAPDRLGRKASGDPRRDRGLQALLQRRDDLSKHRRRRRRSRRSRSAGRRTPIMRCMPNTPAAIGKGMMVVYSSPQGPPRHKAFVEGLLATSGEVATIDSEGLMDAVTAVSGSGPAYIFHFIECLTAAAENAGLPAPRSQSCAAMQTVYGAASLAAESQEEPAELRRQVTSPNGTTAAALRRADGRRPNQDR